MAGSWRGFGRERYSQVKLGLAAVSVAGFAGLWTALSAAHGISSPPEDVPTPTPAGPAPTPTRTSILSSATLVPVPTSAAPTRARSSRGS